MKYIKCILPIILLLVAYEGAATNSTEPTILKGDTAQAICVKAIELDKLPAPQTPMVRHSAELCLFCNTETQEEVVVHSILPDSLTIVNQPLIDGVRLAYADHRPIVLSPDIVWLTIARGFARHIEINAESLRHMFVKFSGKKKLTLFCKEDLLKQPAEVWESYIHEFPQQIAKWTNQELIDAMTADFSTTTTASYTASQVLIMSAMKQYFDYEIRYFCGIPTIYLEGTPEDWERVVEKTEALRKYELDWWVDQLVPVLKKIVAAAEGEVDKPFWNSIYRKPNDPIHTYIGCSPVKSDRIDGWITRFYPYIEGKPTPFDSIHERDILNFPPTCGQAPMKYIGPNGRENGLHLYAGLVGLSEDSITKALRPEIAWFISKEVVLIDHAAPALDKYFREMDDHPSSYEHLYGEPEHEIFEEIVEANEEEYVPAEPAETEEVFVVVEKMPEFPGGQTELSKYLAENTHWPEGFQIDIQGRCIVQFIVEKDGSITNPTVVRSVGAEELDREAIRVIESMPKWHPGEQQGKAVRVIYNVPVNFKLQ